MKQMETEHYVFHYGENTKAEADIAQIAACQEACYQYICNVLRVSPAFKIQYFLVIRLKKWGAFMGMMNRAMVLL